MAVTADKPQSRSAVRTARFSQKEIKAAQARYREVKEIVDRAREDVIEEQCRSAAKLAA